MHKKLIVVSILCLSLLFPVSASAATYYVQKGDTLYLIGKRYGVSAEYLRQANGLKSTVIYPGQKLWVPDKKVNAISYTVQKGDTLYKIGQKYGVTDKEIKALNGLTSNMIYPGQVLLIPNKGTSGSSASNKASRSGNSAERRQEIAQGKISAEEYELMAKLVYGEARGEPYEGQVAVAAVILNRVKSPLFPNTIKEAIFQPGAFSAITDGQAYLTPDKTAYKAVNDALNGWDPSGGALYYWNPAKATSKWIWSRPIIKQIGNHVFAK